ncbi:phosphomannomutase/phosphoglucomutase [Cumulibacter manganitolerans]|uniref:phosphomannomutase/phosphoglucomutase n=1 Tax=Cumulibacter manganitolerans TaxID=1884992 RepID=UPI00129691A7|nr:phosphomannomutase/phosphoglucomutase [Cumulibacter manganitolerans]
MQIAQVLDKIVKAYDVRGLSPQELSPEVATRLGAAFALWLRENDLGAKVVIAGDMRPSTPALIDALADGITAQGLDVLVAGLSSTDQLYFASGDLRLPGIQVTASHNPATYNGMKLCRAMAAPIGADSGLADIKALAARELAPAATRGRRSEIDTLQAYADHLHALVPLSAIRPLKIVVDAGNGMAGLTAPVVLGRTTATIVPMYFELDGSFPNHPADPLNPDNLVDLQEAVRAQQADLGLAFDGDADRCFVVDEHGDPVSPSAITALIADRELAKAPGQTVVHNVITSKTVPEVVSAAGGIPSRTKVGHSNMKARMAQTNAVFGGEHSAHYYFRDFFFADTGMLAAMHVLAALGEQDGPLSQLVARYDRYAASGEINSTVADTSAALRAVRAHAEQRGARIDDLDGITADFPDGAWFNVRPSNTEPLLRLNVEARDADRMSALRDEMLALIRR